MDRDYLIKLTLAVYKVTKIFPSKEPLKFLIREKVNQILADFILKNKVQNIKENIDVLNSYFGIAEKQNWVDQLNFLVLKREYSEIKEELEDKTDIIEIKEKVIKKSLKAPNSHSDPILLNNRCERILEVLKEKEKAQIWEFKKVFPEVTKRTLRRDFEFLLKQRLVIRAGENNNVYYMLK
jgi:chaperonin cofactor prefoldin